MLLGVIPLLAAALGFGLVLGAIAVVGGRMAEASTNVNWDPVWLGGEGPWGVKIYRRTVGLPKHRGWRLEIIYDGLFCLEKEWIGSDAAAKYMKLELVQAYAQQWINEHPTGGPCVRPGGA